MKQMPWRFIVLSPAEAGPGEPVPVTDAAAWLRAAAPRLQIAAGGTAIQLDFSEEGAFDPAAIAERVGSPDSAKIDAVLHHPEVQRIESFWRGLRFLLGHTAGEVGVEVLAAPRPEIAKRFRRTVFDRVMDGTDAFAPSLVLLDLDLTHRPDDLALMRELAEMAMVLQAPFVASASPGFFDLRYVAHVQALPDPVSRLGDPPHAAWRAFQASDEARWIALTLNRYLQRPPHQVDRIGYAETHEEARPDTFLWGQGIWLVGAAAARSARTYGHALDLSGRGGHFDGLATRDYPVAANELVPLATEIPMPEEKAMEFSRAGFTPVVGRIRSDAAILPIAVTVFRLSPGRLTVEGTLAYQMMAGRLAQYCTGLLAEIPSGDERAAAELIRSSLQAFLGGLAGADSVVVETAHEETGGKVRGSANVLVRPNVPLEGKAIDFRFVLPLP